MDNMRIEKFDKEKHYDSICEWFKKRNLNAPKSSMLSNNGIIVPDIACGFLYLTDSSLGFLDFYISNPMSDEKKRHKALEIITNNLIMWAKDCDVSHLLANSQIKTIQKLAFDNGFKDLGFSLTFMKEL